MTRAMEDEHGVLCETLDDRNIDPDRLRLSRNDDLQSRSEAGAGAADSPSVFIGMARRVNLHPAAEKLDLQFDGFQHV